MLSKCCLKLNVVYRMHSFVKSWLTATHVCPPFARLGLVYMTEYFGPGQYLPAVINNTNNICEFYFGL